MHITSIKNYTIWDPKSIKIIAFDADDTLWHNEQLFRDSESTFCKLFEDQLPEGELKAFLFEREILNLPVYGYGAKGFMLSMIETALQLPQLDLTDRKLGAILSIGKNLIDRSVVLIDGVKQVLELLQGHYRLIVITKGDLLEQEKKLRKSGLEPFFHHIEIMSEKHEDNYLRLLLRLDCKPEQLLMVGNSLKSDIRPVLAIGCFGVHIPYPIIWEHERIEFDPTGLTQFAEVDSMSALLDLLEINRNPAF